MIAWLRAVTPEPLMRLYHRMLSWTAAVVYRHPSREMVIIGVTGTTGKTTTCYLIAKALEASGYPTGCTTTALFKIGDREWLNDTKMTMLGRFQLQKTLRQMVRSGCRYAVIETSSQGVTQFRHASISYDVAVFTNLTPEHIEAHGGFENYKRAKIEFFRHTAAGSRKQVFGRIMPKIAVLNARDPHAPDFALTGFDRVVWYGASQSDRTSIQAEHIEHSDHETHFCALNTGFTLRLPGAVNILNALAAISVCDALSISLPGVVERLASVRVMPGRYEWIEAGQPWKVLVDYAHEPEALTRLYQAMSEIPHKRIIHVLGSAGGGRDVARRPVLGRIAGEQADIVIVTNEDPYDDDPRQIMDHVAEGARQAGKTFNSTLFVIEDRRQAIQYAMNLAQRHDVVLLTGKGSEQAICVAGGKKIPWDERVVSTDVIHAVMRARAQSDLHFR